MARSNKKNIVKKYRDSGLMDLKTAYKERCLRADKYGFAKIPEDEIDQYTGSVLDEINLRLVSMRKQVYEIGGLLIDVKRVLGEGWEMKFGEWVGYNLPFSHRTANNYMNVYKVCMGTPELADMFKSSILYTIASEKFPDELRQELLDNAKGEYDFTQKELAVVLKKYANEEIDLESEEVKDMIFKQKSSQDDARYKAELKGMKSELEKRLQTLEKLNKFGLMEPSLPEQDNKPVKKHFDLEEKIEDFIDWIDHTIVNFHQN